MSPERRLSCWKVQGMRNKLFYRDLWCRMLLRGDNSAEDILDAAEAVSLVANREDYFCEFTVSSDITRFCPTSEVRERVRQAIASKLADEIMNGDIVEIEQRNDGLEMRFTAKISVIPQTGESLAAIGLAGKG